MAAGAVTLAAVRRATKAAADPKRAIGAARYFKTGPGQYGAGDKFLGITVPEARKIARAYRELAPVHRYTLLRSPWHEERLVALLLLVDAHRHASAKEKVRLHRDYLAHTAFVNNWDLVDTSAPEMVGSHIATAGTKTIEKLARSSSLWERRIAIVSTLYPISQGDFAPALLIAERLSADREDLIHKAVGWMLREVGKRDIAVLRTYLDTHAATMPRTSLRYAIERMDADERREYMAMKNAASPPQDGAGSRTSKPLKQRA